MCCRQDYVGNGCNGKMGGSTYHTCVYGKSLLFSLSGLKITIFAPSIGPTISKITTKTSTVDYAGSKDPIFIKICNGVICCETLLNDPSKPNFDKGQVDVFEGSLLNQCQSFSITSEIKTVRMRLEQSDGWRGEYVIIKLSNENEVKCPITTFIDDVNEPREMTLSCGPN